MVVYSLKVKCNFEGVKLLYLDLEDYEWCFKVKCGGCGEESPNWHSFSADDEHPLKGGRGSANFLYKCKLCSRENSVDLLKDSLKKVELEEGDKFKPLANFDCRGLDLIAFQPKGPWIVVAENSDSIFKEVDLSENDWADFDTNAQQSVGIYDFESTFQRVK